MLLSDRSLCIILFSLLIRIGAMAQRLESVAGNRVLAGSNPTEAVLKKKIQFHLPHLILPVFFGRYFTVLVMCKYQSL